MIPALVFAELIKNNVSCFYRSDEFEGELLDDKKWVDEFKAETDSDLANTANDLLSNVNDPKLANSEVNNYYSVIY